MDKIMLLFYVLLAILIARGLGIIPIIVFGDSAPPGYYRVDIQGAKVVSEGGYFNFYIKNTGNTNLTVTFLNYTESEVFLQPNDAVTYRIIAPEINLLYQNVTYVFQISYGNPPVFETYPYTVTIVKADLTQRYAEIERQLRLYVPLLMITTGICLFIGTSYVVEQVWKFVQIVRKRRK